MHTRNFGYSYLQGKSARAARQLGRTSGQGNVRRSGGGDIADDEDFTAATGQGLVVSTGILGDLVLPAGAFDPGRADEIRDLAAQAAVYATQARGPGTLRAYRSAWRQYEAWCTRLGLPALSGDPRLVGMYLTSAAERLAPATLQVLTSPRSSRPIAWSACRSTPVTRASPC